MGENTKTTTHDQSPYPGSPVEEIVARVNDQVISTSDYEHALQDLQGQAQQHQWTEQQLFDQKATLLRDLIDQQLLISRGKELGITGETELVKELDQMRKQNHLATMDDLQKAAESQGVNWADFQASLRNRIISQEVIREEVGAHINVSPSEIKAYYDQHKQDFDQPEQVRLSEILIPTADPDNAAQVAEAKQKADDAEAKLKSGTDFSTLAKSVSAGVTASSGGDMGEFKRGQLGAKILEDQTFDLKAGQYTKPIRTKQGYVILEVTAHNPGGVAPLKDVEPQIENEIGMQKMSPALRQYLTKLRENAYIEIKTGYEDSGASPNEMKPIYSAYAPPTKTKKRRDRTRFRGRGRGRNAQQSIAVAETAKPAKGAKEGESSKADLSTMKAGKREKIRFGQAPRETLPPAPVKTEDAGANGLGTQVAANTVSSGINQEDTGDVNAPAVPEKKTRFSDEARHHKKEHKGPKIDPFAPPPTTTQELATQEQQDQPLGLNGNTSKIKKKNPRKEGPKRRLSDEKKSDDKDATPSTATQPPASPGSPEKQ